jgi:hypothetical protein
MKHGTGDGGLFLQQDPLDDVVPVRISTDKKK